MKKLTYYVLICAIIASHSKISRAADADADPDELNQKKIVRKPLAIPVTEEGDHNDRLYIKLSHLYEIISSPPGEHETMGFDDPYLNGFKCVKFKNKDGKEETYLLHGSFDQKYISRFPNNDQLVSFPLTMLTPGIPAWGVSVELPSKKKSFRKKSSHKKHRSKKTKKISS